MTDPAATSARAPGEVPVTILYKVEGNKTTVTIPPAVTCHQGDSAVFSLHPAGHASGFAVSFKKASPFEGNSPIHHGNPKTGKCKAKADHYEYTVEITASDGRVIVVDPIIIVTDP
jgi:hypothetical protein